MVLKKTNLNISTGGAAYLKTGHIVTHAESMTCSPPEVPMCTSKLGLHATLFLLLHLSMYSRYLHFFFQESRNLGKGCGNFADMYEIRCKYSSHKTFTKGNISSITAKTKVLGYFSDQNK